LKNHPSPTPRLSLQYPLCFLRQNEKRAKSNALPLSVSPPPKRTLQASIARTSLRVPAIHSPSNLYSCLPGLPAPYHVHGPLYSVPVSVGLSVSPSRRCSSMQDSDIPTPLVSALACFRNPCTVYRIKQAALHPVRRSMLLPVPFRIPLFQSSLSLYLFLFSSTTDDDYAFTIPQKLFPKFVGCSQLRLLFP